MRHHYLESHWGSLNPWGPFEKKEYQCDELDLEGIGPRVVALINMKRVYIIDQEEGIEIYIANNVPVPERDINGGIWVRNVIDALVRDRFLKRVDPTDLPRSVFTEMQSAAAGFLKTVMEDDRPNYGSNRQAREGQIQSQRTVPAMVLRDPPGQNRMAEVPPEKRRGVSKYFRFKTRA